MSMKTENWFGLLRDGELIAVILWQDIPSIHDFGQIIFSSSKYEIVLIKSFEFGDTI